ncbi:prepilin-type N-terminal cleavage/methylation domain-containing protein [Candidatus Peregrinibacteria bacterium]|nr:prepilin-type N-terminal cleavage/methylation domain-containing protein [Candidatus Peregrinibacteria bacterium]
MKIQNKKGFTLIELLIVIAIIGILAVAFLPTLLGAPAKGRDTQRVADLQKVQKVLVNANLAGDSYPDSTCVNSDSNFKEYIAEFGGTIPTDPQEDNAINVEDLASACTGEYAYVNAPSNDYSFGLYANMETEAAGNVSCDALSEDNADLSIPPKNAEDSCYAILTQ